MRPLTLDEKISIKGELARKPISKQILVTLNMPTALNLYYVCFGKSASRFNNPKLTSRRYIPEQFRQKPIEDTPRFAQLEENHYNRSF